MVSNENQQHVRLQESLAWVLGTIHDECQCQYIGIEVNQPHGRMLKSSIGFGDDAWEKHSFESYAIIPIKCARGIVGEIHLADQRPDYLTDEMIRLVNLVVPLIGETIYISKLEEQRQRYLGSALHEIRNPLSVINGICALGKYEHSEKHTDLAKILQKEVDRINGLLTDLALALLPQNSQLTVNCRPLKLSSVITSAVESMQILFPQHEIIVQEEYSDLRIYGDFTRLEQVVRNLLSNAAKFSIDDTPIWVCLSLTDHDSVLLTVRDVGRGIPKDQQGKVFEPFFQGPDSLNKGGMGLGLHICAEIVRRHAGKIWLTSTPDVGTTFFVELPRFFKKTG